MQKIVASNFRRLIGVWKTEGNIFTEKGNLILVGTDSYEFILDGNYILHKADVTMGNEKSETFEIIFLNDSVDKAIMQYYNTKGESGQMKSSLIENEFTIDGDKIKFVGTIDDKNSVIIGKWFIQADNAEWNDFIELKLTKQA
jgi:hypothetical protein